MLPAVSVSELVVQVEDGLKEAVMPEGRPETANATVPANPPVPLTVKMLLAEELGLSERLADEVDSVKAGVGAGVEMFSVMAAAPVRLPDVPRIAKG
ncbi:MAG TPA: hypothetical protein VMV57_14705 [Terracidiphilus sp.]|nr:hypothetical protein [Terracidiphilus sp.]